MPGRTDPTDWLDELYAGGPAEEPPADLDDTIRRAAAEAVAGARGQRARRAWYRRPARLAGLAMAATVALAVGVLLVSRTPGADRTLAARPDAGLEKAEAAPARDAAVPQVRAPAEEVAVAPPAAPAEQIAETSARATAGRQSDAAAARPPPLQRQAQRKSLQVGAPNAALDRPPAAARRLELAQAAPEPAAADTGAGAAVASEEPALTLEDLTPPEQSPFASLVPGAEDCNKSEFFDSGDSNPYALCTKEDGSRDLRHADCGTPYPIPDGAVVEASDDALVVTHGDAVTTLSCHDGSWVASNDEPDP